MAIPDLDAARIANWCAALTPEEFLDRACVEYEIADRHVTIHETSKFSAEEGEPWIRVAVARLRYTEATGQWTLYWADRHSKFHLYRGLGPSPRVQKLLDFVENSGDPIFWG